MFVRKQGRKNPHSLPMWMKIHAVDDTLEEKSGIVLYSQKYALIADLPVESSS